MKQILQMSIVATSGMTLFSYILSRVFKEKFLETTLLNQLVFPDKKETNKNHPAGFAIHYAMGTFFSAFYYRLLNKTSILPNVSASAGLGFINGLLGISAWHSFFTLHSNPPKVNYLNYYLQLLPAHVVFGALNGLVFKMKNKSKGQVSGKETL